MIVDPWLHGGEGVKLESPMWSNTAPHASISATWKGDPSVTKSFDFLEGAPNLGVYSQSPDF